MHQTAADIQKLNNQVVSISDYLRYCQYNTSTYIKEKVKEPKVPVKPLIKVVPIQGSSSVQEKIYDISDKVIQVPLIMPDGSDAYINIIIIKDIQNISFTSKLCKIYLIIDQKESNKFKISIKENEIKILETRIKRLYKKK
jgi:hypothetical protein